jgi:hypothetical protein
MTARSRPKRTEATPLARTSTVDRLILTIHGMRGASLGGRVGQKSGPKGVPTAWEAPFAPKRNFRGEGIGPLIHDKFTIPYN